MRLIGHLESEKDARRLSVFLKKKGIETHCDGSFDVQTGHVSYQIWVYDEDKIGEAAKEFEQFTKQSSHAMYDLPEPEVVVVSPDGTIAQERTLPRRREAPLTTLIIFLCVTIFFFNAWQEYPMAREGLTEQTFLMTPIQAALLFDFPPAFEELEAVIKKHEIPMDQRVDTLSPEVLAEVQRVEAMPMWHGVYAWMMLKLQGEDPSRAEGPLFEKISQGEVWRFFSPALLHTELLHILFNMIWVWVLSRVVEQRIGIFRLALLSVIVGICSNTAQYLMSGPFFIGYSGVVMGLAGFIWMREKIAPWEGYPLQRSTILFLLLFVFGMFAVQMVSFALQLFTTIQFSPNIANTAHIVGGIVGALLGRLSFFAERVVR